MKQPEKQSQELMLEVQDDVREEQFLNFWRKYKGYVYTFVTLVLLGFLGESLWDSYKRQQSNRAAALYAHALVSIDDNQITTALEKLSKLEEQASSSYLSIYRVIAQFHKVDLLQKQAAEGSFSVEAVDILKDVSNNPNNPESVRQLATYIMAKNLLGHNYEKMPKTQVIERLQDLAVPGNEHRFLACELLAQYAVEDQDYAKAKDYCDRVLNEPSSEVEHIKVRCGAILATISHKLSSKQKRAT